MTGGARPPRGLHPGAGAGPGGQAGELREVSGLLLEIWRLPWTEPLATFQDSALDRVRRRIPFRGALWVYTALEGQDIRPHAFHLVDLSPEIVGEYLEVKHLDRTLRGTVARPGACVRSDDRNEPPDYDPRMRAFNQRWGLDSSLSVMLVQPFSRLAMFISLHRPASAPRFTDGEMQALQAVVPSLGAAHDAVRFRGIETASERPCARCRGAMTDPLGRMHVAEDGLQELLHLEWPEWQGPGLPRALLPLAQEGGAHRGARVAVLASPPRGGFTYVWVRPLGRADTLTSREVEVARAWAAGEPAVVIAERLGLSRNTVRNRIQDVYGKLRVASRTELQRALET